MRKRERFEEAAKCRQASRLEPDLPGGHLALARILVEQSDPAGGEELAAAIREDPSDAESLYDLGVAICGTAQWTHAFSENFGSYGFPNGQKTRGMLK